MPSTSPRMKSLTPRLSEQAKHLRVPDGIVSTGWPAVRKTCVEKLGAEFDPWQDNSGRLILSKRSDGHLAAMVDGVGMSLPRQVGKTHLVGYMVFALCVNMPGLLVIWTAHHSATSSETFMAMQGFAKRAKVVPHVYKVFVGSGDEEVRFHNGSRILFGARERGFGRGIPGVDVLIFDEAQILSDRAMSNMLATLNTSKFGLQLYIGTPPKPEDQSESFKRMRREALAGTLKDGAWIEFGADADADDMDRAQWKKMNPSYPSRTPAQSLLRLKRKLTDADWRREGMGIWDEDADGDGPLSKSWPMLGIDAAPADGIRAFGVAFSADGMKVSLGGCIVDGSRAHVELIDAQQGPVDAALQPLADWFIERVDGVPRWRRASTIVISGRAGAAVLERLLLDRKVPRRRIMVASSPMYFQACGMLLEQSTAAAREAKRGDALSLTHLSGDGQAQLDESAKKSIQEKRTRDGAWGWTSPAGDETPVEAVSLALYGARTGKPVSSGTRKAVIA